MGLYKTQSSAKIPSFFLMLMGKPFTYIKIVAIGLHPSETFTLITFYYKLLVVVPAAAVNLFSFECFCLFELPCCWLKMSRSLFSTYLVDSHGGGNSYQGPVTFFYFLLSFLSEYPIK